MIYFFSDPVQRMTLVDVADHPWVVKDCGSIPRTSCLCKSGSSQKENQMGSKSDTNGTWTLEFHKLLTCFFHKIAFTATSKTLLELGNVKMNWTDQFGLIPNLPFPTLINDYNASARYLLLYVTSRHRNVVKAISYLQRATIIYWTSIVVWDGCHFMSCNWGVGFCFLEIFFCGCNARSVFICWLWVMVILIQLLVL